MPHVPPNCIEWIAFDACYEEELPQQLKDHFQRTPAFDAVVDGDTWRIGEALEEIEHAAETLGLAGSLARKPSIVPHPFAIRNRLLRQESAKAIESASRLILEALARHSPLLSRFEADLRASYDLLSNRSVHASDRPPADPGIQSIILVDGPSAYQDRESYVSSHVEEFVSKFIRHGFRTSQELHDAMQCVAQLPSDDSGLRKQADSIRTVVRSLAKSGWQRRAYHGARGDAAKIHIDRTLPAIAIPKNHVFLVALKQVSQLVANRLRCTEEAALAHLTSPYATATSAPVIVDFEIDPDESVPSRIVLTLDPELAPREVERIYKAAREMVFPGRKLKDLSEFQIALLYHVFWDTRENPLLEAAAPTVNERTEQKRREKRWLERQMHEWNRRHAPSIQTQKGRDPYFQEVSAFRKAALVAYNKFLKTRPIQPEHARWHPREEVWTGVANPRSWY